MIVFVWFSFVFVLSIVVSVAYLSATPILADSPEDSLCFCVHPDLQ